MPDLRTGGRGYTYRGTSRPDPKVRLGEQARELLAEHTQRISFRSSRLRALSADLNERIAQALLDGLKVAAVARAAGLSQWAVRVIGDAAEEVQPPGVGPDEHLRAITVLSAELAAVEDSRSAIEQKRLKLLASARRRHLLDDYELASASGVKHEHNRTMTRGVAG
ncbi:hypothetical protein CFN17_10995 [Arthrobacter sp. PM3]|nr:hypothetical protein CFN17_10995 [Arthrobacter sp. PM3]